MTNGDAYDRLDMTGTIGNNAVFTANGGQEDYVMTYVTWRNAYEAMLIDYQFTDKKAEVGKTYFYYLEDIDIAGII